LERRYNQVLSEKEIMAGEIVKLRDQMEELRIGRNGRPDGETSETSQGISYNPNNPYALQRKISKSSTTRTPCGEYKSSTPTTYISRRKNM
jgi:hypothetical protein